MSNEVAEWDLEMWMDALSVRCECGTTSGEHITESVFVMDDLTHGGC